MWVIPNTTVTILRGSSIDEYSGTISNETAIATGQTASITEQTRLEQDPSTGTPRVIRYVTGRLENGTSVTKTDRLLDEETGRYFSIRSVRQHSNPYYTSEVILDLERIDNLDP